MTTKYFNISKIHDTPRQLLRWNVLWWWFHRGKHSDWTSITKRQSLYNNSLLLTACVQLLSLKVLQPKRWEIGRICHIRLHEEYVLMLATTISTITNPTLTVYLFAKWDYTRIWLNDGHHYLDNWIPHLQSLLHGSLYFKLNYMHKQA